MIDRNLIEVSLIALPLIGLTIGILRYIIGANVYDTPHTITTALTYIILANLADDKPLFFTLTIMLFIIILLMTYVNARLTKPIYLYQIARVTIFLIVFTVISFFLLDLPILANEVMYIILFAAFLIPIVEKVNESFLVKHYNRGVNLFAVEAFVVLLSGFIFSFPDIVSFIRINILLFIALEFLSALIIGRYTGLRLTELWKFRAVLRKDFDEEK